MATITGPLAAKQLAGLINNQIFRGIFGMDEVQWTWYRHEDCDQCMYLEDLDPEEDGGEEHVFCMHEKRQDIITIKPRPEPCPYFIDHINKDNRPAPRSFDQQFEDLITARVPERVPSPSISESVSPSPSATFSLSPSEAPKLGAGPGKWSVNTPDGVLTSENFDQITDKTVK